MNSVFDYEKLRRERDDAVSRKDQLACEVEQLNHVLKLHEESGNS